MIEQKLEKMIEIAQAKKEELLSESETEHVSESGTESGTQHQSEINENDEIPDPMEISFDENTTEKTTVS